MMKRALFSVAVLMISAGACRAQGLYYGNEWMGDNGAQSWILYGHQELAQAEKRSAAHVKTMLHYNCDPVKGTRQLISRSFFDRAGNLVRFDLVNSTDSALNYETYAYRYNWKNQLVARHDSDMGRVEHHEYTLNEAGQRMQDRRSDKWGNLVSITDYTYNDTLLVKAVTASGGVVTSAEEWSYSESGKLVSHIVYDDKHSIVTKKAYAYDARDLLTKYTSCIRSKADTLTLVEFFTYEHDITGAITSMTIHRGDNGKAYYWNQYAYDAEGVMTWHRSEIAGNITETFFVYDTNGVKVKERHPRTPGYDYVFGYAYYEQDSAVVLNNILFASGSSMLIRTSCASLDSLGDYLAQHPQVSIEISGHTDDVGAEDANQRLSLSRAQAVAAYLVQRGIDQSRVSAAGYGSSKPIAANDTDEGRKQNRRVEVVFRNHAMIR